MSKKTFVLLASLSILVGVSSACSNIKIIEPSIVPSVVSVSTTKANTDQLLSSSTPTIEPTSTPIIETSNPNNGIKPNETQEIKDNTDTPAQQPEIINPEDPLKDNSQTSELKANRTKYDTREELVALNGQFIKY
jgi:LAS superfamily LD-carboxypeptidase LdcB